jgi:hypothetical protein
MCGITGYIGESKNPIFTYQLITKLFKKSECRGIDAAGYWGTESGNDGRVLYHKEPGRSSDFVKNEMWKLVCKHNPNLLLVHARGASKSFGEPANNENNHPFTSSDKSIGLIHNGRIDDNEYHSLKQKYELKTQCDSEILLRIFEAGENDTNFSQQLAGIKDIFGLINEGHMAVAIGERNQNGNRMLWLFRNRHRPLWIIDVRDQLGQIFFVSEPNIWEDALRECSKGLIRNQKLIELPVEEIWQFSVSPEEICPKNVQRFKVCKKDLKPWQFDGNKCISPKRTASFEVITNLDDKDRILQKEQIKKTQMKEIEELPSIDIDKKCDELIDIINDIRADTEQLIQEQSIQQCELDQLLESLEEQHQNLKSIMLR